MPSSSNTLAMYNPASYFQYSNTVSVYSSDVSLVKHKAKLVGTSPPPPPRGKKERKEEAAGTYHRPKFDKMIEPIVRNSRLDHTYFKGASDPLPVPAPLPSPYKSRSPLSNSVNGLSNKYHPHPTGKRPPTPPKSPVHNTPLLPIFNQLPNSKSVFGIARAVSPPTKSSPLHQSQSTSYLVPQHPLIPPMSPHHLLSLNSLKKEHHQGRHSESSCDEERDPDPQGEETETAPENDAEEDEQERRRGGVLSQDISVTKTITPAEPPPKDKESGAVDDSVTRCVCGFLHDDGYMICCDQCQVWQHVDCMEIDRQNIPDEYLCEECSPRRVDKMKAIGIQIQKIKRLTDKTVRDNDDDVNSDSSHSSQERPRQRGGARKGKATSKTPKPRGKRGSNTPAGGTGVRRRKSGGPGGPPNSISPGGVTPPAVKNKKMGVGLGTPNTPHSSPPNMNNILHSNNKRKMITVAEKKQNHSSKNNTSISGKVLSPLNHHKIISSGINEKKNHTGVKRMGKKQQEKNNHKRKNATLLGALSSSLEPPAKKDKESPSSGSSLLSTTPSKPVPASAEQTATSSDEEDSKPMTRWIDNYEEATCNYYAPDLRARIATIKLNGSHQDTGVKLPASLLSTTVQKCRASLLSSGTKILVTSTNMSSNQALIEMRGKYLLATGDRKNVPSPGQHVFFYAMLHEGIDIIIDCKTYGNDARFVRRSCKPNAVMKHCIDKGSIHIYLTALNSIPKNSEVTVAYSSGGNPDQCTCGDKASCSAAAQKTKLYTERKHQTQETIASPIKLEPKPSVQSVPSPPPVLPPPTPTESEEKVEVKSEEEEEEEKKEQEAEKEEKAEEEKKRRRSRRRRRRRISSRRRKRRKSRSRWRWNRSRKTRKSRTRNRTRRRRRRRRRENEVTRAGIFCKRGLCPCFEQVGT
uniref:Histone-lysine N-methyltransferase 2E n=1 Tax=Cacopsylla melanoneura TaxID=428564 RepID=A0A8D9AC95_9HEMI